jgi:CRISPR-associated endonuclease Csn1
MARKILGLDLGTNSIGWALVNQDFENKQGNIIGLGSRIIPMPQDILDKFGSGGQSETAASNRTTARSIRKLYQRDNLRRERLHRVLNIIGFLPDHYKNEIDFISHKGQFINHGEPKIPYFKNNDGKFEFLFKDSFNEMVEEFKQLHPALFQNNKKIPYDWTIYYLRKKALKHKISKEELAWVLLNFNRKRGYYQLGEENEINEDKIQKYEVLKVKEVIYSGDKIKGKDIKLYDVYFENGWKYDKQIAKPEDWEGKTKEFIVSETISKNSEIKRTYKSVNSEIDWIAIKQKTEQLIANSGKSVGQFIYDALLDNPQQKINGKLIRTIERKLYKAELKSILENQIKKHDILQNEKVYNTCVLELYPNNKAHSHNIINRDFIYLFLNDIIFYQRPLKSKISLISDCSLESRIRKDTKEKVFIKCIAKSNPVFQEFRLWQFLNNLKFYEREKIVNGKTEFDVNVTAEYLEPENQWIKLFDSLNDREKIDQKQLLGYFKLKEDKFRWNYVEDKEYPCNETRAKFISRIKKIKGIELSFLTASTTQHLWHILYSVTDPDQRKSAISKFSKSNNLNEAFVNSFEKFPPYKKDYGSYSEKAIKKLLPLMRFGKYWDESNIQQATKDRIVKIINGEFDENISNELREKVEKYKSKKALNTISDFCFLPEWFSKYIVYSRHSETSDKKKWETAQDITDFLNPKIKNSFKQHSLRNPIVEQVLTETLRVVRDIWNEYGKGEKNFFDEIHIELGREMKNDQKTRKRISEKVTENEITNQRIKELLKELLNDGIEVRPYSPSHQEILKIYEEGVYQSENKKEELEIIDKIRRNNSPSKSDIQRYKLWLEQGYHSPYTKRAIMLSELFTHNYQIEHIFPQARYFDDSLNNKVICEAEVNQLKGNQTAYEFISQYGGTKITMGGGKEVEILSLSDYDLHIKNYFIKNKIKRENLLSADIPESFINRQMNDSRYISKIVKNLLSKIVREENEQEVTSKKVISVTGSITSKMKADWGLNDVWNDIITPRFERMNKLTDSSKYGAINPNTNKFLPAVPDDISKGFNKKRIDHRHHALDAIVIAFISRTHINYLNNLNAKDENDRSIKFELRSKLCKKIKSDEHGNYKWQYLKPYETFTQDVREKLETTIVSFKQNNRVINKSRNKFQKWVKDENGVLMKKLVQQTKGENWAIRKPLHTPLPYGERNYSFSVLEISKNIGQREKIIDEKIREKVNDCFELKNKKVGETEKYLKKNPIINEVYQEVACTAFSINEKRYRKRQPITKLSNRGIGGIKTDEQAISFINKIADKQIRIDLLNHLKINNNDIDVAFSNEGIENFNANRKIQVFKLPIAEASELKFALGTNRNTIKKFGEAQSGTNLFFSVYWNDAKQKREYETIPLNVVIEYQKQVAHLPKAERTLVPKNFTKGNFLFTLSPNDLVYVPTSEDGNDINLIDFTCLTKEQIKRVYKCVSFSNSQCFFVRNDIATAIKNKVEFSALNKTEKSIGDIMIKEVCWKLKISRLGKIIKVGE